MPPAVAKEVGHAQEVILPRRVSGQGGSARREDLMVLGASSADDDNKSVVSVSASLSLSAMPIDTTDFEDKYCIGCANSPSQESPFTPEAQERRKGNFCGLWPWKNYRKRGGASEEENVRVPYGNICGVCHCIFGMRGLEDADDKTTRSPASYFKSFGLAGGRPKQQEHLKAVRAFILSENNDDLEGTRGNHRLHASKAVGGTILNKRSTQGTRTAGQEEDFVEEGAWDESKDGAYVSSNMKMHFVHGAYRKGAWVKRGREGVFRRKVFSEQAADETQLVAENDGQFGEERLARKRGGLMKGLQEHEKQRKEHALEGPPVMANAGALFQALQSLGAVDSTGSAQAMLAAGSAQGTAPQEGDLPFTEDTTDEEEEVKVRKMEQPLASFFGASAYGAVNPDKEGGNKQTKLSSKVQVQVGVPSKKKSSYARGVLCSGEDSDHLGSDKNALRLNGHTRRMRAGMIPLIDQIEQVFTAGSVINLPAQASLSGWGRW